MSQSSLLVGLLFLGFLLYVAAKGRLTTYTAVLWGPTSQPVEKDNKSGDSGGGFDVKDAAKFAAEIAPYFL